MKNYIQHILNTGKDARAELIQNYSDYIIELKVEKTAGWPESPLSENFIKLFDNILEVPGLENFTPVKFYWLSLVDQLMTISGLHFELDENNDPEDKGDIEEDIFNFWNETEYSRSLFDLQEEGSNLLEASETLTSLLENQILSFFHINISMESSSFGKPLLYHPVPEKGDRNGAIILGSSGFYIQDECLEKETISLLEVDWTDKHVSVEVDRCEKKISMIQMDEIIVSGVSFPGIYKNLNDELKKSIEAAGILKKYLPQLNDVFSEFSCQIIPMDEKGIVSYSIQSLPGFSTINVTERDRVDAIDDLLHENGHHVLNRILNTEELIVEDDEKIYYSPWRKALRPVRGIYHAVFTFHWAFLLFNELGKIILKGDLQEFNDAEKSKSLLRCLEEYRMIEFCLDDIKVMREQGKITDSGFEIIMGVFDNISAAGPEIALLEKKLNIDHSPEWEKYQLLVEELKSKKSHYSSQS